MLTAVHSSQLDRMKLIKILIHPVSDPIVRAILCNCPYRKTISLLCYFREKGEIL